jgi:hypothetical protein
MEFVRTNGSSCKCHFCIIKVSLNSLIFNRIAFPVIKTSHNVEVYVIFDQIPRVTFILEILVKFNTTYYTKGKLVDNRL